MSRNPCGTLMNTPDTTRLYTENQFQAILHQHGINLSHYGNAGVAASLRRSLKGVPIAELQAAPSLISILAVKICDVFYYADLANQDPTRVLGKGGFVAQWVRADPETRLRLYRDFGLVGTPDPAPGDLTRPR